MNLPVVSVGQFKQMVMLNFEEEIKRPIFGLGKGGIGKTESMYSLAEEMKIGFIDIRLLLYSEVDLKGIPYPDADHVKTIWLQNNILPTEERDGKKGILLLDEITSVNRSVRTAAYQLLNERKLGEYKLPDGWMVVCLGNGEEDGGEYQGMEGNFANRCSIFEVQVSLDDFKAWAIRHNVNELVLAYLSFNNNHLHTYNNNFDDNLLFASPRSWKAISDILNKAKFNEDDKIQSLRIKGNVGNLVGDMFLAFCTFRSQLADIDGILAGKQINEPESTEAVHISIQALIAKMTHLIKEDKQQNGKITKSMQACAHGCKWLIGLNSVENSIMGLIDFIRSDKLTIINLITDTEFNRMCPELDQFIAKNEEVFS